MYLRLGTPGILRLNVDTCYTHLDLATLTKFLTDQIQKGVGNKMEKDAQVDWFLGWTQKVDRMAFYLILISYVLFIVIYTLIVNSR